MPTEKTRPPTKRVDMSPEAVDQRLRDLGQLYRLVMSLRGIKPLGQSADLKKLENEKVSPQSGLSDPAQIGT